MFLALHVVIGVIITVNALSVTFHHVNTSLAKRCKGNVVNFPFSILDEPGEQNSQHFRKS